MFATRSMRHAGVMTDSEPADTLWSRGDRLKPGPRPAHTLEELADACVGLADEEGLAALSMRQVARRLGTAAASLYRYVDGKDDLGALMADRVLVECDYPPLSGDLGADVLGTLEQSRALYKRHPWLGKIDSTNMGPNAIRYLDRMVGALAPAGLDSTATMMGVALLSGWVRTFAAQEMSGAPTGAAAGQQIAALMTRGDYPHLSALFGAGDAAVSPPDTDSVFRAGVEALLFGIARAR